LYEPLKQKFNKKPSTQRQTAKKEYLKIAKKRKPNHKEIKKAIKKQLKRVMTKLSEISLTAIAIIFLAMNLSTLLKEVLSLFLCFFYLKIVLADILIS